MVNNESVYQWIDANEVSEDRVHLSKCIVYGNPSRAAYKKLNYMTYQTIDATVLTSQYYPHPSIKASLLIQQGFNWRDVFGLLLVVRDMSSPDMPLISRILTPENFKITNDKELIYGVFWLDEFIFNIPYSPTLGNLEVSIELIKDNDINTNYPSPTYGTVNSYPVDMIPLIDEMPVPDNILLDIGFDTSTHVLRLTPRTADSSSLHAAIYRYFNIKDDQIINISINYIITYGYTDHYLSINVSNEADIYAPFTIGLDFTSILKNGLGVWNISQQVEIIVSMEINVNNKVIRRENRTNMMNILQQLNTFIADNIAVPQTINPVKYEYNEQRNYTTPIHVQERRRVVPMYQYIFVELIDVQIIYEKKSIKFDNVTFPCYLRILAGEKDKEQIILNEKTSDLTYFFDLSKLTPLSEPTTYQLLRTEDNTIIGKGDIILPNQ
jgi:hypothetical protein